MRTDREGIALLLVVMITLVVAAIAAGAALIGANSALISHYDQRLGLLESVADAGLEENRAAINGDASLFPETGYATLESGAAVYDANGDLIPGVTRSVYAGPVGGGLNEYGTFGTIISVAEDGDGSRVIRRLDMSRETLAKYAYFTDVEPSNIGFGSGDQLYGPVHSNDEIKIWNTGATFHERVTTAKYFEGIQYATFHDTYEDSTQTILFPGMSNITALQSRAATGNLDIVSAAGGTDAQAMTRIEFMSIDIDGDGEEEGFIRVYKANGSNDADHVTGHIEDWTKFHDSELCGDWHGSAFKLAKDHTNQDAIAHLQLSSANCYLGGSDSLSNGFDYDFAHGKWQKFPGSKHATVIASGRADAEYLWPLDRDYNTGYRGVIYVDGKVVVSGTVRGRVTLAATGNVIIGDDLVYENDPGGGTCEDILGLISGGTVYVANNLINAPHELKDTNDGNYPTIGWMTYDNTQSEFIHAVILALNQFTVETYWTGSNNAEPCEGTTMGRGCLYITGGLIQSTRGPVAISTYGYRKRYAYDACAATSPPPYFPSTGHFYSNRYHIVDPTGFTVAGYFDMLN